MWIDRKAQSLLNNDVCFGLFPFHLTIFIQCPIYSVIQTPTGRFKLFFVCKIHFLVVLAINSTKHSLPKIMCAPVEVSRCVYARVLSHFHVISNTPLGPQKS